MRVGSKANVYSVTRRICVGNRKNQEGSNYLKQKYCASATHTAPQEHCTAKEEVLELVDFCHKKDIIFSVDENYIEFAEKGQETTLAGMVKEYENLFVIRSVTKFYGMAGIRLGYGIAAPNMVEKLENVRLPWSINSLASCATLAAFNDTEFIENTKKNNRQRKSSACQKPRRNRRLTRLPVRDKLSACKNPNRKNHIHQAERCVD